MQNYSWVRQFLYIFACGLLIQSPLPVNTATHNSRIARYPVFCQRSQLSPNFLVVSGGGAPSYKEIALEKNVLYFQCVLRTIGSKLFSPTRLMAEWILAQPVFELSYTTSTPEFDEHKYQEWVNSDLQGDKQQTLQFDTFENKKS